MLCAVFTASREAHPIATRNIEGGEPNSHDVLGSRERAALNRSLETCARRVLGGHTNTCPHVGSTQRRSALS